MRDDEVAAWFYIFCLYQYTRDKKPNACIVPIVFGSRVVADNILYVVEAKPHRLLGFVYPHDAHHAAMFGRRAVGHEATMWIGTLVSYFVEDTIYTCLTQRVANVYAGDPHITRWRQPTDTQRRCSCCRVQAYCCASDHVSGRVWRDRAGTRAQQTSEIFILKDYTSVNGLFHCDPGRRMIALRAKLCS